MVFGHQLNKQGLKTIFRLFRLKAVRAEGILIIITFHLQPYQLNKSGEGRF